MHIHHVVIGVILVMVSGVTMVTLAVDGGVPEFTVAAIFFGIGRGAGARRVRSDPAPAGRVLVRGRPHFGGRGVRRDRGRRAADPRLQPAVVLRHRHLAFRSDAAGPRGRGGHRPGDAGARGGGAAQGQGVDRTGRHVHHAAADHRRDPGLASARAVGALALREQAAKDAPRAGAGAAVAPSRRAGQTVAAARRRG